MKEMLLAAALLVPFVVTTTKAEPTAQAVAGFTAVDLSDTFVDALGALGVTPASIAPGALVGQTATFPISGGALDLETSGGEIIHTGGLSLSTADTTVRLSNFTIDTINSADPLLTGLVSVNGDLVGRLPLFALSLNDAPTVIASSLSIPNVDLMLGQDAADALNNAFNINALSGGIDIGSANVQAAVSVP
jgi:hypothetical protein